MGRFTQSAALAGEGIMDISKGLASLFGEDVEEEERLKTLRFIRERIEAAEAGMVDDTGFSDLVSESIGKQYKFEDYFTGEEPEVDISEMVSAEEAAGFVETGVPKPTAKAPSMRDVIPDYDPLSAEELQLMDTLTATPEGREDYEGGVLKQTGDDEQIRKNRQMLGLLRTYEDYYEAGAPQSAENIMKDLAKILTRSESLSPEGKLQLEREKQLLRFGPESARAGFEERRGEMKMGELEKRITGQMNLQQQKDWAAMQRIKRREQQHAVDVSVKMGMAKAKMNAADKIKFGVTQGRSPESAIGVIDMEMAELDKQIAETQELLDSGELIGALEDSYEKTYDALKKARRKMRDAKIWVTTEVGKIKPEAETDVEKKIGALSQQQRTSAISAGRKWLADPANANNPKRAEFEAYIRALENYGR